MPKRSPAAVLQKIESAPAVHDAASNRKVFAIDCKPWRAGTAGAPRTTPQHIPTGSSLGGCLGGYPRAKRKKPKQINYLGL